MAGIGMSINNHPRLLAIVVDCSRFMPGMLSSKSLRIKLMKESRYLYEIGRFDDALQLLHIAFEATPESIPGYYEPLCEIAAAIYYEQNDLKSCQEYNARSQRLRQASLGGDFSQRMFHYQNLGNLAAAQGNFKKALMHYEMSLDQLMHCTMQYNENDMFLEMYHMMTGHIYFLDGDDRKAIEQYREAIGTLKYHEKDAAPLYAR